MGYRWCVVPHCMNTSKISPNKLFVSVPKNHKKRKLWLLLARRDPNSIVMHSNAFMCEDHFDLPNDMENYMQYHVMGAVGQVRMKPGCIPRKFDCQPDRMRTLGATEQPYRTYTRKTRKTMMTAEEYDRQFEDKSKVTEEFYMEESASRILDNEPASCRSVKSKSPKHDSENEMSDFCIKYVYPLKPELTLVISDAEMECKTSVPTGSDMETCENEQSKYICVKDMKSLLKNDPAVESESKTLTHTMLYEDPSTPEPRATEPNQIKMEPEDVDEETISRPTLIDIQTYARTPLNGESSTSDPQVTESNQIKMESEDVDVETISRPTLTDIETYASTPLKKVSSTPDPQVRETNQIKMEPEDVDEETISRPTLTESETLTHTMLYEDPSTPEPRATEPNQIKMEPQDVDEETISRPSLTDSDCSKRWCYKRDAVRRSFVRHRGKPGTGSSGEAVKKRSDLLSFLGSLPSTQRGSITNVVDENPGDNSVIIENTHDDSEQTQTPGDRSVTVNCEETESNTQEVEYFIGHNNYHKKYDKAKSDSKRKHNVHSQERLRLLKQIANRNSAQNVLDENDLFFGSMAKIVKKLPPYDQVQLRLQIGSLVGKAELSHISNNAPQGSASISKTK